MGMAPVFRLIVIALFITSLATLSSSAFGLLNIPGIMAACLGLMLTLRKRYWLAGALGIVASSASMIAQSLTAICSSCTVAAFSFGFAGIMCIIKMRGSNPFMTSVLTAILCGALICYTIPGYFPFLISNESHAIVEVSRPSGGWPQAAGIGSDSDFREPARLYLSLTCPACKAVLPAFIDSDPEGRNWVPVIVPSAFLEQGQNWLYSNGYRGVVRSEAKSPSGSVPLLICNGHRYTGEGEIMESPYFAAMTTSQ